MVQSAAPGRRHRDPSDVSQADADKIIDAAFTLVATEGWRDLSFAAVAAAAGLPIAQIYRLFGSKQAILRGLYRRVDEAVLAEPPQAEAGERPRDRLFDLLMRRFDALRPYKPAIGVLRRELPADPMSALCASGLLIRSMRWMLAAAHIATGGLRGAVAVRLTAAAYLSTTRAWYDDDSPDLARTMAVLDARLRRIEGWLVPAARRGATKGRFPPDYAALQKRT
jgi:AcrR family transcriptional regulator